MCYIHCYIVLRRWNVRSLSWKSTCCNKILPYAIGRITNSNLPKVLNLILPVATRFCPLLVPAFNPQAFVHSPTLATSVHLLIELNLSNHHNHRLSSVISLLQVVQLSKSPFIVSDKVASPRTLAMVALTDSPKYVILKHYVFKSLIYKIQWWCSRNWMDGWMDGYEDVDVESESPFLDSGRQPFQDQDSQCPCCCHSPGGGSQQM